MKIGEWIKDTRTWRRAAFVALVLLLAVGWLTVDILFQPRKKEPTTVEIPDLCGLGINSIQADEWLDLDIEYRYDESTPAGVIFSQTPTGGSRRRLNDRAIQVTVVVSLGHESIRLPQIAGRDVYEVATELRNLGLVVNTVMQSSPREVGRVLASEPRAGESVPRGTTVTLTVSQGEKQKTVCVPQLCGLSRADALIRLWLCQLGVGEVVEVTADAPAGIVFRQSHTEGTVVLPGTKITIYVSKENE